MTGGASYDATMYIPWTTDILDDGPESGLQGRRLNDLCGSDYKLEEDLIVLHRYQEEVTPSRMFCILTVQPAHL